MLSELHVRNFALIGQADLEFREGLTVLSGETGGTMVSPDSGKRARDPEPVERSDRPLMVSPYKTIMSTRCAPLR